MKKIFALNPIPGYLIHCLLASSIALYINVFFLDKGPQSGPMLHSKVNADSLGMVRLHSDRTLMGTDRGVKPTSTSACSKVETNQGEKLGGTLTAQSSSAKWLANRSNNGFVPLRVKKAERQFRPIILKAARRYKIDPALVMAVIMAESSYNHRAISKSGARGLMQLMPSTAKALGVKNSFDPVHNINGGVKYLKQLLTRFKGDTKLALAAYNAGSRKVLMYNGVPPFKATRYYIKKVTEFYRFYKQQLAGEIIQTKAAG
jgi:hypothetical protein